MKRVRLDSGLGKLPQLILLRFNDNVTEEDHCQACTAALLEPSCLSGAQPRCDVSQHAAVLGMVQLMLKGCWETVWVLCNGSGVAGASQRHTNAFLTACLHC